MRQCAHHIIHHCVGLGAIFSLIWLKFINLRTAFSSHCAKRWMLLRPLKERKFHKKSLHLGIMTIRVLSNKLCVQLHVFFLAWKESLTSYKHALSAARSSYFSALIEENKNNPRYLFHTVASLTKSHASADPCIPATYSSNDFMNFFDTKLIKIRETIQNLSSAPSMASPVLMG